MLAVAFDAGGVTTGPITVPFIMALGLGVSATRGDPDSEADSFGVVALASVGPVLAVLILGLLYRPDGAGYEAAASLSGARTAPGGAGGGPLGGPAPTMPGRSSWP